MNLCRVVGSVVCPVQNAELAGKKLLICQPVDLQDLPLGASYVAVDLVQAGEGDLVLTNKEGGGARIVLKSEVTPVQQLVVAVVDEIHVDTSRRYDPKITALTG